MEKNHRGYLLRQRAFLKLHMITIVEEKRFYGLTTLKHLQEEYNSVGYRPVHSEIYKALHELLADGILYQVRKTKEGTDLQQVIYYRIQDKEKAKAYKKLLKEELHRCIKMMNKALKLNYP